MKPIKCYILVIPLMFFFKITSGQEKTIDSLYQVSTKPGEKVHIDFVGTTNLQGSIAQADEVQGSAGLGVIYERFMGLKKPVIRSFDIEAFINVASTVDTLTAILGGNNEVTNQRLFGAYVLNPISSKQSIFLNSNIYFNPDGDQLFNKIAQVISGVNFRVNSSNALWKLSDDTEKNIGVIALRYGIFHEFLPDDKIRDEDGKRKFSVFLGFNLNYRGIAGDLSSDSNASLRESFLGTTDLDYSGMEFNFGFRLNNIIAEFSMPSLGGEEKSDIEGLTDTQFLFSIRFVGGFSLKLDTSEKEN